MFRLALLGLCSCCLCAVEFSAMVGETIHVDVPWTNEADVPARVLSLIGNCACTSAALLDTYTEPGEQGIVQVRFKVPPRSGDFQIFMELTLADRAGNTLATKGETSMLVKAGAVVARRPWERLRVLLQYDAVRGRWVGDLLLPAGNRFEEISGLVVEALGERLLEEIAFEAQLTADGVQLRMDAADIVPGMAFLPVALHWLPVLSRMRATPSCSMAGPICNDVPNGHAALFPMRAPGACM